MAELYADSVKARVGEEVKVIPFRDITKAPAIHQTAAGNPITLTDAGEGTPVVDFAMDGKTEQVQTTGAQLLKPPKKLNETLSNITWKYIKGYVIADGSTPVDSVSNYYIVGSSTEYENIGLVTGAYTLSGNIPPGTEFIIKANSGEQYIINNSVTQIDFTIKNEETYRMFYRVKENTSVANAILKVMINSGSEPLPWEPYTGGQPSPSPDYPQEIVNAGKYNEETQKWEYEITIANEQTDPDKNQTVTLTSDRPLTKWDKLEKRNGQWGWVYKSNTKQFTGDGTEPFEMYSNPNVSQDNVGFVLTINDMLPNGRIDGYCNNFIPLNTPAQTSLMEGVTFGANSKDFYVLMLKSRGVTDVEDFNTWLQTHNMTIWYQTAEETFVPLTDPEQSALEALTTYFPTTIISNDADCEMEIEYVADTKTYIDNKFAELAQNLAATQNTLLEV